MDKAIVASFQINVISQTREGCIDAMDRLSLEIMQLIGGEPWLTTDDDVKKIQTQGLLIADPNGYIYQGLRTNHFKGPFVDTEAQPTHDGFKCQRGMEAG